MIRLAWRNLLRNRRRTLLTVASLALAVLLLCLLQAVLRTFAAGEASSSEDRVVVWSAISLGFVLPESYWDRLERLPHVEAVTPLSWFGGVYRDNRPENFFPQFASDPATLSSVYTDLRMPETELQAWKADRSGFIAGRSLAEKYGWRLGDRITLKGDIYPVDLDLTLRGVFEYPSDPSQEKAIFFQRDYLEQAMGSPGIVGSYFLRVDGPENVPAVIDAAEAAFANSAARVQAQTEKAFQASFVEMLGNIRLLFGAIGLGVIISVFFITANTMAMAVRERSTEVAVLKMLGFRGGPLLALVSGESLALGLAGGLVGVGLSAVLLRGIASGLETVFPLFSELRLTPGIALLGLGSALAIGLASGLLPGAAVVRRPIAEGLRRVA